MAPGRSCFCPLAIRQENTAGVLTIPKPECWTLKKAEHQRTDAFKLWCWRDSWVPWTARRSNQSILKEINTEYSFEGLILKPQYFGHLMWWADLLEKTLMLGRLRAGEGQEKEDEDEMVGGHHPINGHEYEQTLRDSEGQGSLACCSPWGSQWVRHECDWTTTKPRCG